MVRTVSVNVYADEQTDLYYNDHEFLAIGILLISENERNQVIRDLLTLRCLNNENTYGWYWKYEDCPASSICKRIYHTYNNVEIHYKKIKNFDSRYKIAKKWLKYITTKTIPFNILYIDLTNLEAERFGTESWHLNVYNRFFRTNLKFALKTFFLNNGYDEVNVNLVFHDKSKGLEEHPYFEIKNLKKLEQELNSDLPNRKHVTMPDRVIFIESDHKDEPNFKEDTQLVQLIDLLLGAITQNIFYTAQKNTAKKELAMVIRPLLEDFLENPYRGLHYKRNISFFPKVPIKNARQIFQSLDGSLQVETRRNMFYRDIILKMPKFQRNNLDSWLDKA